MEPKGSLPHSQVPATCPYPLYLYVLQISSHKTPLLSYLPEWKATCSNGAIWCGTVIIYKISGVVRVTHFKVLNHLNSLEENYWLAANQIMSESC